MRRVLGAAGLVLWVAAASAGGAQAQIDEAVAVGFPLGPADAPVVVVEYADFACSACALFADSTWPKLRAEYVDTGRIRWILVPFDIGFRNSEEGARAAYCAAQADLFWPMHDALFARSEAWVSERKPEEELAAIASSIGLPRDDFVACFEDDDRTEEAIDAANRAARAARVRGTPTFHIDGVPIQGALPFDVFAELLERALGGEPGGSAVR